jgi:hypothetical protein
MPLITERLKRRMPHFESMTYTLGTPRRTRVAELPVRTVP